MFLPAAAALFWPRSRAFSPSNLAFNSKCMLSQHLLKLYYVAYRDVLSNEYRESQTSISTSPTIHTALSHSDSLLSETDPNLGKERGRARSRTPACFSSLFYRTYYVRALRKPLPHRASRVFQRWPCV